MEAGQPPVLCPPCALLMDPKLWPVVATDDELLLVTAAVVGVHAETAADDGATETPGKVLLWQLAELLLAGAALADEPYS